MNTFFMHKNIIFNNNILDKYQSKAVLCNKDNYLVIAGAGSGKTLTIMAKVKYLIDNGYKEKELLCISFTNETVNSLKEKLINNNINIDVLTFHKLSLKLLDYNYKIASSDLLKYTIDEFSTWFDYWNPEPCFVEREHVNDDTIGANTVPEGLECGEYVINASGDVETDLSATELICIGVSSFIFSSSTL